MTELNATLEGTRVAASQYWQIEGDRYRATKQGFSPSYWLRSPIKPFRVIHYWATMYQNAYRFTMKHCPDAQLMIFGHAHRQGISRHGQCTLINTGAFSFPAKVWAVVLEDHKWEVRLVKPDDAQLKLGKILHKGQIQE